MRRLINLFLYQGRFFEHPGELGGRATGRYNYFAGFKADNCDTSGCFFELSIQLMVVMIGKQLMNNVIEFLIP